MIARTSIFVLFGVAAVSSSGCTPIDYITTCMSDRNCHSDDRIGVRCIYDGSTGYYCAYEVLTCPTGLRWKESAPLNLRGNCVTPAMLGSDGGIDGQAADGSPDGDTADGPSIP